MIFVEPNSFYDSRMREQQLRQEEELRKLRAFRLHPIQDEIMDIVRTNNEEEIRNTTS